MRANWQRMVMASMMAGTGRGIARSSDATRTNGRASYSKISWWSAATTDGPSLTITRK